MIGRLNFDKARMSIDENGKTELTLTVSNESKYNVKRILQTIRDSDKKPTAVFDFLKNKRTLNQNSLMWELLTIYADTLNGGRKGGIMPEDLYIQMLAKYGVAEFIMTVPQAENTLKNAFRVVKKVDVRDYNGVEMAVFKCYYGSSKYDTKEMANLIDGIFDELAELGVNADVRVVDYYEQWQKICS